MKKTLITSLILGIFLAPSVTDAQVAQPVTITEEARQVLIAEITAKIQELITLLIAQLKVEMSKQMADSQVQTSQAINEVSSRVTVVEEIATPAVVAPAAPTLSVSTICKDGQRALKIETSGEYKFATVRVGVTSDHISGEIFTRNVSPYPYTHLITEQVTSYRAILTNSRTDGANINYPILAETAGQPISLSCN